jgi:hypothetical protein
MEFNSRLKGLKAPNLIIQLHSGQRLTMCAAAQTLFLMASSCGS